ncbi:amidase [Aquibacillus halophilus]|uniref:Amidase n=2 Tax=Aquibacillus halophilus TaxID=930132 RepID=A0A6A8DFE4_9BACI|nr:amidase [Aquibacillus halophilus]
MTIVRLTGLEELDGLGLAELIKTKEIHPKELLDDSIKKLEEINPKLNAVINVMYEQAIHSIKDIDYTRQFPGVPIFLKDITQEIAGEPITSGSKAFINYKASKDTAFVKRMRDTGVLFLGQTNVPEFALMGITEPEFYGPTRNPWDSEYTPGGSSGGSAVSVATGVVAIAGANDGGGSIRIPGAYCGLFGLKPSRGRTPVGPNYGRLWQGASVDHVLTRTVRDSAAMLDELNVCEKAAAFQALPFSEKYLDYVDKPFSKKLTIAYSLISPLGTKVDQECKDAVMKAVKQLEDMGHHVEEKTAPVDGRKIANSYISMYFGEVGATFSALESILGRKVKQSDVEPSTWLLGLLGNSLSAKDFVLSLREWDKASYLMESFHHTYDFYITPTTAFPPASIGELGLSTMEKNLVKFVSTFGLGKLLSKGGFVERLTEQSLERTPFTQLANLTGQPAMTLPLHQTSNGLPCGVQFMAARGQEHHLFQMAGLFEQTSDWIDVSKNPFYQSTNS